MLAYVSLVLFAAWAARVTQLFLRARSPRPSGAPPIRTMAVLGSGGHTAEMLALLKGLAPGTYAPRDYILADTDHTSAQRIEAFEAARAPTSEIGQAAAATTYRLLRLPRSREVGQSYVSSVFTTLYALLHAAGLVLRARPSLLLCNGPGTCIPVCAWAFALRVLGVQHVTIVYVESIARVTSVRVPHASPPSSVAARDPPLHWRHRLTRSRRLRTPARGAQTSASSRMRVRRARSSLSRARSCCASPTSSLCSGRSSRSGTPGARGTLGGCADC